MLFSGQQWLSEKLRAHASREIQYVRKNLVVTLQATIGRSEYEQDTADGRVLRFQLRDYLVDTKELVTSSLGSLPKQGDQILEPSGAKPIVFEVTGFGGEPAWRYSDPFRLKLRIHTKQISS